MLKKILTTLDNLPEDLKGHYKEEDGVFYLQVEDDPSREKISEFRQNNIELLKKIKDMEEHYGGIEPEEHQRMKQRLEEIKQGTLLSMEDAQKMVQGETERLKQESELENQILRQSLDQFRYQNESLEKDLARRVIDQEVGRALGRIGRLKPEVLGDVLDLGRGVFKLVNGRPVPLDEKEEVIIDPATSKPLSFERWALDLLREKPFLFEGSSGSGSSGAIDFSGFNAQSLGSFSELEGLEYSKEMIDRLADGSGVF
ncbi:MAG: hypothetical protein OEY59_01020 [Deltaproteobacteria bacterium]|nr:hypothetical protein [Deltaproteobacteria bacterium]